MKTLYLVVDMQNDFVDGALGFDKASTVVDNIHTYLRENQIMLYKENVPNNNYGNVVLGFTGQKID